MPWSCESVRPKNVNEWTVTLSKLKMKSICHFLCYRQCTVHILITERDWKYSIFVSPLLCLYVLRKKKKKRNSNIFSNRRDCLFKPLRIESFSKVLLLFLVIFGGWIILWHTIFPPKMYMSLVLWFDSFDIWNCLRFPFIFSRISSCGHIWPSRS